MAANRYADYDPAQPIVYTPEQAAAWVGYVAHRRRVRIRRVVVAALVLVAALAVAAGVLAIR